MEGFRLALCFLTRLPVPHVEGAGGMGRALPAFPLVGAVIGLLLLGGDALFDTWGAGVQAAMLLVLWVGLTGGLHLDGVADSADGWAGGPDRARMLAIMRDPRSGAIGVVAVVLLLLTKWAALAETVPWQALVLAPLAGRLAAAWLLYTTPYARPEGLGSAFTGDIPSRDLRAAALLALLVFPIIAGAPGLLVMLAAIGFFYLYRRFLLQRLGGTTGDTAGALVELTETIVLLGFAA